MMGHRSGVMAPGIRDLKITARAVHHAMLAHGLAVQAFRDGGYAGEIGITNAHTSYETARGPALRRGRLWGRVRDPHPNPQYRPRRRPAQTHPPAGTRPRVRSPPLPR